MSVRRRSIQNRLASDLEFERGEHRFTKGLLDARGKGLSLALDERDAARQKLARFGDLAAELASYFNSDPPAPLSRETDLFLLLKEVAPGFIRPLPPTPAETLAAFVQIANTTIDEVIEAARSAVSAGSGA